MGLTDTLRDFRVIELGSAVAGPYTTQVLGAMGADVVKVEPPGGDPFRRSEPQYESGLAGFFSMCNFGKRSMQLDLKRSAGKRVYYDLIEHADVVVENLRPGTADRLQVGYADTEEINDGLVYCSISGYGESGPWSDRPALDPILQGVTGLMSVTGERDGPPVRVGVAIVDLVTAIWSAAAILNALLDREATGSGEYIEMSMFDVGVSLLAKQVAVHAITGLNTPRMGTRYAYTVPYGGFRTKDGEHLLIGAMTQSLWEQLCTIIGREDLPDDDRFETRFDRVKNQDALNRVLEDEFARKTREEWIDLLQGEIPVGPILPIDEVVGHEQTAHNEILAAVEHTEFGDLTALNMPLRNGDARHRFETAPPALGEDTHAILDELAYTPEEIEDLHAKSVIHGT